MYFQALSTLTKIIELCSVSILFKLLLNVQSFRTVCQYFQLAVIVNILVGPSVQHASFQFPTLNHSWLNEIWFRSYFPYQIVSSTMLIVVGFLFVLTYAGPQ